jgi:hypothetical protein
LPASGISVHSCSHAGNHPLCWRRWVLLTSSLFPHHLLPFSLLSLVVRACVSANGRPTSRGEPRALLLTSSVHALFITRVFRMATLKATVRAVSAAGAAAKRIPRARPAVLTVVRGSFPDTHHVAAAWECDGRGGGWGGGGLKPVELMSALSFGFSRSLSLSLSLGLSVLPLCIRTRCTYIC